MLLAKWPQLFLTPTSEAVFGCAAGPLTVAYEPDCDMPVPPDLPCSSGGGLIQTVELSTGESKSLLVAWAVASLWEGDYDTVLYDALQDGMGICIRAQRLPISIEGDVLPCMQREVHAAGFRPRALFASASSNFAFSDYEGGAYFLYDHVGSDDVLPKISVIYMP